MAKVYKDKKETENYNRTLRELHTNGYIDYDGYFYASITTKGMDFVKAHLEGYLFNKEIPMAIKKKISVSTKLIKIILILLGSLASIATVLDFLINNGKVIKGFLGIAIV